MSIRNLPALAIETHKKVGSPPRLIRHHEVVHEAACRIVEGLLKKYPETVFFNGAIISMGAAIHDIGKVDHPDEMDQYGEKHEKAGPMVLKRAGVFGLDSFSQLYMEIVAGDPNAAPDITTEHAIVAMADNVWKGKRDAYLENFLTGDIVKATFKPAWEAWSHLDDLLTEIAKDSDQFLEYCR